MSIMVIELVAMTFSLLSAGIGLPFQIYQNHKRGSCKGFALPQPLFGFFSCAGWLAAGICKEQAIFCVAQIPGFFFLSIILCQFYWYRKKKNAPVLAEIEADA